MNTNLTRRAVLGTVIGGLMVCPFVVRALRRPKQMEFGPDSYLTKFREKYQTALDFPRTFDPFSGDNIIPGREREGFLSNMLPKFRTLSTEQQEKALAIQKRFWSNYSKLDEAEFDYTYFGFNKDGTKMQGEFYMSAHVKLKYGYGMEIVGKDAEGKPIHWIFNLEGDVSPEAREFNIATMAKGFFEAYEAEPQEVLTLNQVDAVDVDLPDNPYLKNDKGDKYTVLSPDSYLKDPTIPPHIQGKTFFRRYFNQRTGILEYIHARSYQDRVFTQATDADGRWVGPYFFNPKYADPAEPLPWLGETIQYKKTAEIAEGIFLPVECAHVEPEWANGFSWRATYSNIRVKRV